MQVKLIKDSIANGIRICTFILTYPRLIHSEMLTHRVFSRNAASSRAIPTKAIIQNLRDDPAEIVWWGKAMAGMQAKEELSGWQLKLAKFGWATARELAILSARFMNAIGLHKQIANRVLEPFQNIRVVVTATEWNNFFALRNHKDAQPEFQLLASMMYSAMGSSTPEKLNPGEWHMPYIETVRMPAGNLLYGVYTERAQGDFIFKELPIEVCLKISASMAAQESYRKSDSSLEKAEAIWERLVGSAPVHASPTEHQAMVPNEPFNGQWFTGHVWEKGVTHQDREGNYWSGNFRNWIQHRQLLTNHDIKG